jgi:hypothetical protein
MTPSQIVADGFRRSPVVMMNEGHHGNSRCARTREIGRAILPAAHAAGCRHLAMEALPRGGAGPRFVTARPDPIGYVGHPEMVALIDAAIDLGWTLIAYEAAPDDRGAPPNLESTNARELHQARNLVEALASIEPEAPLLVWCGNHHHAKEAAVDWIPMGVRFVQESGIDPFCIDQLATVSLSPEHAPNIELTEELTATLDRFGGTAGFIRGGEPPGYTVCGPFDATILSTDNRVVGDPPEIWAPRS